MVRLKVAGFVWSLADADTGFNSSMVRLKGVGLDARRARTARQFQFQYGAIKGGEDVEDAPAPGGKFQFQYGAIKGKGWTFLRHGRSTRFQFQYGAIKGLLSRQVAHRITCFNSSMVRLKDLQALVGAALVILGFNSSMVRLKAVLSR